MRWTDSILVIHGIWIYILVSVRIGLPEIGRADFSVQWYPTLLQFSAGKDWWVQLHQLLWKA